MLGYTESLHCSALLLKQLIFNSEGISEDVKDQQYLLKCKKPVGTLYKS